MIRLSGSKRVLNDTVVSIHSACQTYVNLIPKGIHLLREIQMNSDNMDLVQSNCETLGSLVRHMVEIVQKLFGYSEQLESLFQLNKMEPVPFISWNYQNFSETAKEIYESYKKETDIRLKITQNVHKCNPDQLSFCVISWTHVVYCVKDSKFQAMLYECGLK